MMEAGRVILRKLADMKVRYRNLKESWMKRKDGIGI